uniref:DUF3700 domain-containing protein n=1 Tax=Brassica oleracea var. oleracea TaxID=109376 RepID=A0A0D3ADF4_BRAOL
MGFSTETSVGRTGTWARCNRHREHYELVYLVVKIRVVLNEKWRSKLLLTHRKSSTARRLISPAKSFAHFPTGCMFHSETWLKSFEHPKNKMKAMPRIDSEGVICGANFKVDACSKISVIPRRGSEANWALANTR